MSIWGKIGFKHYQTIYNHISYQGKNKRKSFFSVSPKLFWKPLTFNFFLHANDLHYKSIDWFLYEENIGVRKINDIFWYLNKVNGSGLILIL